MNPCRQTKEVENDKCAGAVASSGNALAVLSLALESYAK
jgi:hypothetical protein